MPDVCSIVWFLAIMIDRVFSILYNIAPKGSGCRCSLYLPYCLIYPVQENIQTLWKRSQPVRFPDPRHPVRKDILFIKTFLLYSCTNAIHTLTIYIWTMGTLRCIECWDIWIYAPVLSNHLRSRNSRESFQPIKISWKHRDRSTASLRLHTIDIFSVT